MLRFKRSHLFLLLGLVAPVCASAANYCIKVNGGFGTGGASFIGKGFALPTAGLCKPWAGFLKTGTTVVAFSTGTGCLSTDGKVLSFSIFSTDDEYFGTGQISIDKMQFCAAGVTSCPVSAHNNSTTFFTGPAASQSCTTKLLTLPATHN